MEQLIGKKVETDITNGYGITIVPAHTVLNDDAIRLLINHRIDRNMIVIADAIEDNKKQPDQLMQQTVAMSKELFEPIAVTRKIPVIEIRKHILPAIQDMSANQSIFELFETVKAKDDYTYQHNIGVGVISTLIGRWMNLKDMELSILSLAATLHDIGKVNIPAELLNKPGKLTGQEFEIVKKHTIYGYELLKDTPGLSAKVARVALQHHERDDGGGYPLGLKKDKIDLFSSIVAVADVFHARITSRYRFTTL